MKNILYMALCNLLYINVQAQLFPESFSYQAVLRDDQGDILANTSLNVRFTIQLEELEQVNEIYSETHNTSTNDYGLLTLTIGSGVPGNGIITNFEEIIWNSGYHLKVEIDNGNGFVDLGIEPLSAVPYSMYSKGNWGLQGNSNISENVHFIGTTNLQGLQFRTNNTPRMLISENGKVGIGTTTPLELVHLMEQNDNRCYIQFNHFYSSYPSYAGVDGSDFYIWNQGPESKISFRTNSGILNLNDEGKVGIGTEFPFVQLHVTGGSDLSLANDNGGFLLLGPASSGNMVLDQNEIVARNNGQAATLFLNTEAGAVVVNDNSTPPYDFYVFGLAAKPGGGSWASYSDANLKHDIKSFDVGLETLLKVNPVNFKYIPEFAPDAETEYVGIIAQDLQKIAPFMVQSAPTVFEDGHSEEFLSVDPSAFTYMLINAVQELNAQNEALKKQIEIQATNQEFLINEINNLKSLIESK